MFPWCVRTKKPRRGRKGNRLLAGVVFPRFEQKRKGMDFGPRRPERQAPPFAARAKTAAGPCAVVVSFLFFTFLFFPLLFFTLLCRILYTKKANLPTEIAFVSTDSPIYILNLENIFIPYPAVLYPASAKTRGQGAGNPRGGRFSTAFHSISTGFSTCGKSRKKASDYPRKRPFQGLFADFSQKRRAGVRGRLGESASARALFTAFSAGTAREKDQSRPKRAARCRQTATAPRWWETGFQSKRPRRGSTPPR